MFYGTLFYSAGGSRLLRQPLEKLRNFRHGDEYLPNKILKWITSFQRHHDRMGEMVVVVAAAAATAAV